MVAVGTVPAVVLVEPVYTDALLYDTYSGEVPLNVPPLSVALNVIVLLFNVTDAADDVVVLDVNVPSVAYT